ncbi:hypothetical protein C8J57DRAFT_1195912 [Mycena rebaudengoi]|nr:hypothetical protein C8J57DRAFT_1195912 [Mycena rebaudengoi]
MPERIEVNIGDGYPEFVDSVLDGGAAFYQIGADTFVVNGWDMKGKRSKETWYHAQHKTIGSENIFVCLCPTSRLDTNCVHEQFLKECGAEFFPSDDELDIEEEVVLFARRHELDESATTNHFSCPSAFKRGLRGRVIVIYEGENDGSGLWRCEKDPSGGCTHISNCRIKFQQLIHGNPHAEAAPATSSDILEPVHGDRSVSHRMRPSPSWASLPGDPTFNRILPLRRAPECLPLDIYSSCCCREPRQLFDAAVPIRKLACTIYGLCEAFTTLIEVQSCAMCKRRFVGPDCEELGVFNYNNKALFTHEILDEYTAAYTTSETPFTAWITVVSRRYDLRNLGPFCSQETFRSAWFAYAKLQYLEGDMICPQCGPSPENTIWDGVTLSFNKKHLLPSLEPPTISQVSSVTRNKTKYVAGQQIIPDSYSRQLIQKVVVGPPLLLGAGLGEDAPVDPIDEGNEEDEDVSNETRATKLARKVKHNLIDRMDAIPLAIARLEGQNKPLARVFDMHFGVGAVVGKIIAPAPYKRFFIQISAEESVLQTVTMKAAEALKIFLQSPTAANASTIIDIPILHDLLAHELLSASAFSEDVLAICRWLHERTTTVFSWLSATNTTLPPSPSVGIEKPWTETGCCYGLPKIRERPIYPKLKHDVQPDVGGKRGAKCSKFYSQYGEKRLTGGIMCVWCTHSICYGFHCIPRGEGRNDVFSALITRWEKPPKRVIYDFACALGPYCMTREPLFFSGTQFLIDDFHAIGHTKCAPAAFLKTYCAVDPRLGYINSSAGECGNSGISRVRKSVSYMSQDRAIVYTKVFLSIWNRQRIRSLQS